MADVAHGSDTVHPTRILVGSSAAVVTVVAPWPRRGSRSRAPARSRSANLSHAAPARRPPALAIGGHPRDRAASPRLRRGLPRGPLAREHPWAVDRGRGRASATYILTAGWRDVGQRAVRRCLQRRRLGDRRRRRARVLGRQLRRPERAQAAHLGGPGRPPSQLQARLDAMRQSTPPSPRPRVQEADRLAAAVSLSISCVRGADKDEPALRWALATGYSSVQRTLHRIEEIVVAAQPVHAVTGDALHDALSLSGSTISDREVLPPAFAPPSRRSRPSAARYFLPRTSEPASPRAQCPTTRRLEHEARVGAAGGPVRDQRVPGRPRRRPHPLAEPAAVGRPHRRDHRVPRARARVLLNGIGEIQWARSRCSTWWAPWRVS